MKTFFVFCILLLFANLNYARKEPRDYWESVMKDQPLPDAIKGLLHEEQATVMDSGGKKMKNLVKDFDSRHSFIIYHSNIKHNDEDKPSVKDLKDQKQHKP